MAAVAKNPVVLPSAATAHIGAKSCVRIIDQGRHEIVPYQTAVDIYAEAVTVLIDAFNSKIYDKNKLQQMIIFFQKAISALPKNNTEHITRLNKAAGDILKQLQAISTAPAAATTAAAAPATLTNELMADAANILYLIAIVLAPPTNVSKTNGTKPVALPPPAAKKGPNLPGAAGGGHGTVPTFTSSLPLGPRLPAAASAVKNVPTFTYSLSLQELAAATNGNGKKGGRRKRNTRHKHKKNKNTTRVGHR